MANITLKGNSIKTIGELPVIGSKIPNFKLTKSDLSDVELSHYAGKKLVLNIFPSVDTSTCALSVKAFNKKAANLPNTVVLNISADLPFAHSRFCAAEGIQGAETLSTFRSTFAKDYNLEIADSGLKGLCSRSIIVVDENHQVLYTEQVPETTQEPNYDAALGALGVLVN